MSELDRNFRMQRERNLKLKMKLTKSMILNYNLIIQNYNLIIQDERLGGKHII